MAYLNFIILAIPFILVVLAGYLKWPFVERWALKFEAWAHKKKHEHREKERQDKKWQHYLQHSFVMVGVGLATISKKYIKDVHWRSAVLLGLVSLVFCGMAVLVAYAAMLIIGLIVGIILFVFVLGGILKFACESNETINDIFSPFLKIFDDMQEGLKNMWNRKGRR